MTRVSLTAVSSLSRSRTRWSWVSSPEMEERSARASRQPRTKEVTAREVFATVPKSAIEAAVMDSGSMIPGG